MRQVPSRVSKTLSTIHPTQVRSRPRAPAHEEYTMFNDKRAGLPGSRPGRPPRPLPEAAGVRQPRLTLAAVLSAVLIAGCTGDLVIPRLSPSDYLRVYLVNESTSKYLSPNPGLCAEGLESGTKRFLDTPPILAPGETATYTTIEIGGLNGICSGDTPQFMFGLCGWKHGASADELTPCSRMYGGQIGFQFECGDTVILRWTDVGDPDGTWTSEVLSAPGNRPPVADFQYIEGGAGPSCTG